MLSNTKTLEDAVRELTDELQRAEERYDHLQMECATQGRTNKRLTQRIEKQQRVIHVLWSQRGILSRLEAQKLMPELCELNEVFK